MAEHYILRNIRALLTEGFTDDELRRLCYDVPDFRPVYNELARDTGKAKIIDRLIEHAEQKLLLNKLLALAKEINPAQYEKHQLASVITDHPQTLLTNPATRPNSPSVAPLVVPLDFVIITALEEERDAVLAKLPEYQRLAPSDYDVQVYYWATLPVTFPDDSTGVYRLVVMPLSGMGRVKAAAATSDAIRRWQPRYIILVGIAGGVAAKGVKLGDILVSDQIVDYELQKLLSEKSEIRWEVHRADPRLMAAVRNLREDDWHRFIETQRPGKGTPNRYIGPIASGDKVIAFDEILEKYRNVWPALLGVEMEAAGVAAASFQAANPPGFFMIRGVSDLANKQKGVKRVEKWRPYACDIAAAYTIALLQSGPVLLSPPTPASLPDESKLTESRKSEFSNRLRHTPWKPQRLKPQPLFSSSSEIGRLLRYSLFDHPHAEDDLNFLFGETGGFWTGHPLYDQVTNPVIPQVIYGPDGCGKTALARALVELDNPMIVSTKILPLFISGRPDISEIQRGVAQALLEFICASPFVLAELSDYQQERLARQLCLSLEYDLTRGSTESAKHRLPLGAGTPQEAERWQKDDAAQLSRFERFLEQHRATSPVKVDEWLRLTHQAVSALAFNYMVISLDLNHSPMTHVRKIISLLRLWAEHKLVIKLFLPQTLGQTLRSSAHDLDFLPLTWTEAQIKDLAHWRFETITRSSGARLIRRLEDIFDDNIYAQFISHAQNNPRRLAVLWRNLLADHLNYSPDCNTFFQENLDRAVEKLK